MKRNWRSRLQVARYKLQGTSVWLQGKFKACLRALGQVSSLPARPWAGLKLACTPLGSRFQGYRHRLGQQVSGLSAYLGRQVFVVLLLVVMACTNKDAAHEHDTYTCPMHPTVISDKPGSCPVCGMDLVRKARTGEEVEITEELSRLLKSPNETVVASIKTIKGEYKSMPVNIEALGVVTYDTRNIYTIPSRIGGRLERVYLKYPFQPVKKGQKVAEIYSPELLTAQREILFLLENDSQNETLIKGAKERLQLLGASEAQISTLIKRKEPQNTFTIYSPYEGYVVSETQQAPAAPVSPQASSTPNAGGMNDGMGTTSGSSAMNTPTSTIASITESLMREGSYVTAGQTLFKIVNTSALRVELNLPAASASTIRKGTDVVLDFGDGEEQTATVDFIQPFFDEGQEFLTIRVYTEKSDKLHIGHLVKAKLTSSSLEAMWVPKAAVLDLGVDKIVFIKDKNVLKPQKVTVGTRTNDALEIKQGLTSSDEIAANAQYLVDSESFIKTQK
jgi:membrane fusion protein, copper/silver efflux system